MCVNQQCMKVSDYRAQNKACPFECNGNGICNNKGNCHCKIGYAPPYCDHPGPGGSDDSGPSSSPNCKLILFYMSNKQNKFAIIIFVGILIFR